MAQATLGILDVNRIGEAGPPIHILAEHFSSPNLAWLLDRPVGGFLTPRFLLSIFALS